MSLFGPIWQSRNKNKIERYIQKKPNEEQLAEIAVKCFFPDLLPGEMKTWLVPRRRI